MALDLVKDYLSHGQVPFRFFLRRYFSHWQCMCTGNPKSVIRKQISGPVKMYICLCRETSCGEPLTRFTWQATFEEQSYKMLIYKRLVACHCFLADTNSSLLLKLLSDNKICLCHGVLCMDLRHRGQSLPAYIPFAVLRESRILCCASVPAGTHHGYGSEQSAIARKVDAEALVLVVVAVREISVCALIHEERADAFSGSLRRAAFIAVIG